MSLLSDGIVSARSRGIYVQFPEKEGTNDVTEDDMSSKLSSSALERDEIFRAFLATVKIGLRISRIRGDGIEPRRP